MMHEDVDDEEEDVILDRRTLIHQTNDATSNSGPILLGINRFDIKVYENPVKLSQTKAILLATTCVSIGMFMGILAPTFPFIAQHMPADLSAIIWLIALKAIGFLIGTFLSAYLYSWFNVCCLLGLSCIAISFGVCSLPLINDLATFYLTSLILGIGLAISYHGIDTLYNRLWTRPSLASVRWLHLLIAFGAIISTLMLFPWAYSTKSEILTTTSIPQNIRPRRAAESNEIANFLASMSMGNEFLNITDVSNQSNNSLLTTTTITTTEKVILKPSVVETGILKQNQAVKQTEIPESKTKVICMKFFCCYYYNETNQNETIKNNTFTCREKDEKQLDVCKDVVASCQIPTSSICLIEKTNIRCRIDQICTDGKQPECSIPLIEIAINASKYITTPTTTTQLPSITTETPSTTTLITTTATTTTTTTVTTTTTTTTTTTAPTTTRSTTRRNKPAMAESDIDDLSENLFYKKLGSFIHSITSINLIYLFLAFTFFLLGIFYSTLAMRGEGTNLPSTRSTNTNSFSLLFGNSHRTMTNSNNRLSLFSDRASLKFVFLLSLFYFILAGIENSCIYLTFIFAMELKFEDHQSLTLQFLFFFGLLLGRLIDILMDYGCFLFNTRITNRTKKQSDKFHLISIKFCILIRLILLFILCSTLSFSHLFQDSSPTTKSSIPSIQMFYFIFFLIGLLLASLPTLILFWIERDLSLNDSLLRILSFTITISEMIFPSFLFYTIKHVVLSYLFYLFIGSCLLLILFIFILFTSKKWQRKRMYRILPTSIDMEEISIENHSDNDDNDELQNEQTNFDNERTKGLKGH